MDLLGKKESILKATWPKIGEIDEIVIKSSVYLMEAAREFRLKLKAALQPPKAKKGPVKAPEKPTHATIYVAKTYPPWQCTVLSTLKEMYEESGEFIIEIFDMIDFNNQNPKLFESVELG